MSAGPAFPPLRAGLYAFLPLLLLSLCSAAHAEVSVSEQILQTGQFAKPSCTSDTKDPDYDDCVCDADVRYPQIAGLSDPQVQARLNDWFKAQASKAMCEGDKITPAAPEKSKSPKSHMGLSVHYEQTFSSPHILSFKFTDWAYTGGAHGNGSVIGVIVDLGQGTMLGVSNLFSAKNLDDVNTAIYNALIAKPEEEIFRDQVDARKGEFIKNGECQGCTLILTPEGVHVLFQTYEVAPYGAGNTDVLIPAKYISYEAVKQALTSQKK